MDQAKLENWRREIKPIQDEIENIVWEEAMQRKGFTVSTEIIARGKFGDVVKAVRNGEQICCKVVKRANAPNFFAKPRVLPILKSITAGPGTIKIYAIFKSPQKYFFFMDRATGSMKSFVNDRKQLEEKVAIAFASQISAGIHWLHSRGIAHRRLSPSKILLDSEGKAKISGLEYYQEIFDINHKDELYPCWMDHQIDEFTAPEVERNRPHYALPLDIFSFGAIIYYMITGSGPINLKEKQNRRFQLKNKIWSKNARLSDEVKAFLDKLLHYNAKNRSVIEDIVKHPLLNKYR